MERWIYMHESCQQGGSSSASVHAWLRCNTIQSPMLKWDSSRVKFTGSVHQNSKVLLLASLHSSVYTKTLLSFKEILLGGFKLLDVLVGDRLEILPGSRVIFSPHADEFIEMMRPQDGGVPGQVFKVVHDDSHKQVQHLDHENTMFKNRSDY